MHQKQQSGVGVLIRQRLNFMLALLLCSTPLLTNRPLLNRILLSASALAFYTLSLLFWAYFFPYRHKNKTDKTPLFRILLDSVIGNDRSIQSAKDGTFNPDYFALRSKPAISTLLVDENTAVITKNANGKRCLLLGGLWTLRRKTAIFQVFDLRPAVFTYGPDSRRNPITQNQHQDNLRSGKTQQIGLERTRCVTSDGVELIPVLKIIYRIKHPSELEHNSRDWLALSAFLESAHVFGNVAHQIEDMIGAHIANHLKQSINTVSWDQIERSASSQDKLIAYFQRIIDQPAQGSNGQSPKPLLPAVWRNVVITSIHVEQVWAG